MNGQRIHEGALGRSSHIAYRTKKQLYTASSGVNMLRTLSRRSDLVASMGLTSGAIAPAAICEMAVTAATGTRYTYGLPIFAQNEKNISYGVQGSTASSDGYIVNRNVVDGDESIKVGEERTTAYASSFLLTDIQTPDYVDRSLNGPTRDDFGGYTRFQYTKAYSLQRPYRWRTPFRGLVYQRNTLSDAQDDVGTFASGEKEIAYLSAIQTKTHTALFIIAKSSSGTLIPRTDGLEANAYNSPNDDGNDKSKKGQTYNSAELAAAKKILST